MKKLVMLVALAVACSLSFAQTDTDSGKKMSKKGGSTSVVGCLKSDSQPYMLMTAKNPDGVKVDTSDDWKAHNGHKVTLMGSWEGTGADKSFKATSMKHMAPTCSVADLGKGSAG